MQISITVILLVVLATTNAEEQLSCYHCEDCSAQQATVVQCPTVASVQQAKNTPTIYLTPSTPSWGSTNNPWNPMLTPPTYGPGYPQYPQYPEYPGYPNLTPPPLPPNYNDPYYPGYPGGPYLTPPVTGYPGGPILTPPGTGTTWYPGQTGYPGGPILTQPTYYPWGVRRRADAIKRSVCVTVKSKGTDGKETVQKGCAEAVQYSASACRDDPVGVMAKESLCQVCNSSLCNQ